MKVTVKLDDTSPLINYQGTWTAGLPGDDAASQYSDGGTYKVAQSNDGVATIPWHGTQITVYGAKRPDHGNYTVTLDNAATQTFAGFSDTPVFQTILYQSPVMVNGPHMLVVQGASTNAIEPYFDIDYITIDGDIPGSQSAIIEDSDPAWSFEPADAWSHDPSQFENYSGGSGHSTRVPGAKATLQFEGNAMDLYGLICKQCGGYWVTIDNGTPVSLDAHNDNFTEPRSLLYMARGLEEGIHTLVVTNIGQGGSGMSIDNVFAYGDQPRGVLNKTAAHKSSGPNAAVIALAVLIPILIIIAGIFLIFFLRRKQIWPFNSPYRSMEGAISPLNAFRSGSPGGASPYPGMRDPRGLNIDMSSTHGTAPILTMPVAPSTVYGSEIPSSGPGHPFAPPSSYVYSGGNAVAGGSSRPMGPYENAGLPEYREALSDLEQQIAIGDPVRPATKSTYTRQGRF